MSFLDSHSSHLRMQRMYSLQQKYISVWLEEANTGTYLFRCNFCGQPVAQVSGNLIQLLPEQKEARINIIVQCRNPKCGAKYCFHQLLRGTI